MCVLETNFKKGKLTPTLKSLKRTAEFLIKLRWGQVCQNAPNSSTLHIITLSLSMEVFIEWWVLIQPEVSRQTSVSAPMFALKATFFHEAPEMKGEFNASAGWLIRFKQ
jgi:hypothetical protein